MKDQGFKVFSQVPLKTRRVDLVCIPQSGRKITAIELKVKDWKRAFEQALGCTLFADRVYVALAQQYAHRVQNQVLDEYGIGLLGVDHFVEIIRPARANHRIQPSLRQYLRMNLRKSRIGTWTYENT